MFYFSQGTKKPQETDGQPKIPVTIQPTFLRESFGRQKNMRRSGDLGGSTRSTLVGSFLLNS